MSDICKRCNKEDCLNPDWCKHTKFMKCDCKFDCISIWDYKEKIIQRNKSWINEEYDTIDFPFIKILDLHCKFYLSLKTEPNGSRSDYVDTTYQIINALKYFKVKEIGEVESTQHSHNKKILKFTNQMEMLITIPFYCREKLFDRMVNELPDTFLIGEL